MSRSNLPTESELAILNILWRNGPSTVRKVHEALVQESKAKTAYTTTLKLMQIMHEKKLLKRDESQRSHVYRPSKPEEKMQKSLVGNLMEKAFSGSASQLVIRALSAKPASKEELDEIRTLLDQMEDEK